ncbi:MAG: Holliday junction branch migration protein RuvA [Acidobacteria bacterium]|nr:Holliday junction branch migration protein RuvA [Acidobacteriota bacterium]
MIAFLRGRLIEKHPNRLVVDVHGVGYDVQVPLSTFYDLAAPGEDVALRIHTHVREDQIALYGFATRLELDLFERLIGVGGIGPKIALAALSGIEPHELVRAVGSNDTRRLSSIPGIGKKTAERISLELRDKLPALPGVAAGPVAAGPAADADRRADLVSALVNLGYPRPSAERAIDGALETEADTVPFEHLLRRALRSLARSSTR